jgi:hypothetical protein
MSDPYPNIVRLLDERDRKLDELARQIGNLRPDWQQPERFYEARSEIAAAIRRLIHWQSPKPVYQYSPERTQLTRPDVK